MTEKFKIVYKDGSCSIFESTEEHVLNTLYNINNSNRPNYFVVFELSVGPVYINVRHIISIQKIKETEE